MRLNPEQIHEVAGGHLIDGGEEVGRGFIRSGSARH
jgi:hypothetical protein